MSLNVRLKHNKLVTVLYQYSMAASSSSSASGNKRRAIDDESSLSSSKRLKLSSPASASGGMSTSRWKYDVFLSFRGEDTRNNFTDHLYRALHQNGIITFKDDERLERGTEISSELSKAIEESRFSIVIFSKDYASSTWCLEELAKIVEFMESNNNHTVIPVFYNVDPSDVRKQKREFKEAFDKHQQNPKIDGDKIQRWIAALERAANIVGDFISAGSRQDFPKLKTIKLSYSHNLIETPDFTMVPNLEMLDLEGCTRLRKVHDSVGFLKRLNILNLKGCKNLVSFPSNVSGLKLLKILNLQGCSKLDQLPQNLGELEVLEKLDAGETAIRQVPPSIARLSNLEILDLEGCTRLRKVHDSVGLLKRLTKLNLKGCKILVSLPSNVSGMKLLKILNLQGCSKLDQLPQNLEELEVLEELDVGETAIRQVPPSIARLSNLEYLSFCGCKVQGWRSLFLPRKYLNSMGLSLPRLSGLFSLKTLDLNDCRLSEESLPSDLGSLCSLKELRLSNNNFVSLPNSIKQLSKLQILCLENCRSLQSLPELPPKIIFVGAEDCISLEDVSNALSGGTSPNFVLHLLNCLKLHENLGQENNLAIKLLKEYLQQPVNLSSQFHIRLPGFDIPEWFSCKNDGNSVEIGLPPDWLNDDFMGIAMCGVFEPALENLDCIAEMGCTMSIMRNRFHFVFKIHSFTAVESHHLWLAYVSRVTLLSLYLNPPYDKVYGSDLVLVGDSTCIHAEFGIQYKKRTGDSDDVNDGCDGDGDDKKCKAIKCGIRLVYKQDKNYFQESSAAEGSVFHQKDKNHFLESELLSSAAELLSSAVYNHWRSLLKPGIDYYFNKRRYNRRYYSGWGLDSQSEVWERGLQIKNFLYSTKRTAVVLSTQRKTVNMELGTTEKTVFMSLIGHEKRLDVPKVGRGDYSDSDEE